MLSRYRTVIQVHGCFWHRHPGCRFATTPKAREEFWKQKFEANVARDQRSREGLLELGWRVVKIWVCELTTGQIDTLVNEPTNWLQSEAVLFERTSSTEW